MKSQMLLEKELVSRAMRLREYASILEEDQQAIAETTTYDDLKRIVNLVHHR
jgi:hypothetical protein